jgi:choice-of-anchor C domain-containing protein
MALATLVAYSLFGGVGPDGPAFIFFYEVNWGMICALGAGAIVSIVHLLSTLLLWVGNVMRSRPPHQSIWPPLIAIPGVLLIGTLVLLPVLASLRDQGQQAANIVKNGDFEQPAVVLDTDEEYKTGQAFGSWTISSGSIMLIGTRWIPAHGAQSVDLAGDTPGVLSQDLPTRSGMSYMLSFAMAGAPECTSPTDAQMQVWWGSRLLATISASGFGTWRYAVKWQYHTYQVRALAASTHLSFISLTPSPCGPTLDNVRVEAEKGNIS